MNIILSSLGVKLHKTIASFCGQGHGIAVYYAEYRTVSHVIEKWQGICHVQPQCTNLDLNYKCRESVDTDQVTPFKMIAVSLDCSELDEPMV